MAKIKLGKTYPDWYVAGAPLLSYFINLCREAGKDPNEELCLDGIVIEDMKYITYPDRYYVINNINCEYLIIEIDNGEKIKYRTIKSYKFRWTNEDDGVVINRNGRVVWFENYDNKDHKYRFVCSSGEIIDRKV